MLYDNRYEDNIILKREAFQNLLTNIKNYPIIDIDYVEEGEQDVLHNDTIWSDYTDYTPCLKITYGDERTTKGNIIFAAQKKKELEEKKIILFNKKIELNELKYTYEKYKKAFEENKKAQSGKEDQLARLEKVRDTLTINKNAYLVACLSLLNFPFSVYYNSEYDGALLNKSYASGALVPVDTYQGMQFDPIPSGQALDQYSESISYFIKNSEDKIDYLNPLTKNEAAIKKSQGYTIYVARFDTKSITNTNTILDINNIPLVYQDIRLETTETNKYLNFRYTTLEPTRKLRLLSELERIKNSSVQQADGTYINIFSVDERDFIDQFQKFVRGYNYINFVDELQKSYSSIFQDKTLSQEQIEFLRTTSLNEYLNFNNNSIQTIKDILNNIYDEDKNNWLYQNAATLNYQDMLSQFYNNMEAIAASITQTIANNLKRLKLELVGDATHISLPEKIKAKELEVKQVEQDIESYENKILNAAGDRILYGYKYVKLGNNIKWNKTEQLTQNNGTKINVEVGNYDNISPISVRDLINKTSYNIITTSSNSEQLSGTFRIGINDIFYEIPIKGFSEKASNQDINIKTQKEFSNSTNGGTINMLGNIAGSGNIVTNNGNIYVSGGGLAAQTYLAVRGYPVDENEISTHQYNNADTAGLWYDGSVKMLRTWNISQNNNTAIFGTSKLALIDDEGQVIGFRKDNETDTIEARNLPTDDKYVDFKARNIFATDNLQVHGKSFLLSDVTITGDIIGTKDLTIKGNSWIDGNFSVVNGEATFWNQVNLVNDVIIEGHTQIGKTIYPKIDKTINLGGKNNWWKTLYCQFGEFKNIYIIDDEDNKIKIDNVLPKSKGNTGQFWRGGPTPQWSNTLTGQLILSSTNGATGNIQPTAQDSVLSCSGAAYFNKNLKANKIFNAVYNDYAEFRKTINLEAGRVVIDKDDGSLECSSKRLQPGAQVISDTYGHSMGYNDDNTTPLAVAGRVLVYTYQDRRKYHAGMAVCSAPDGTIDIMSRKEIKDYPDCIIGIVSEIPTYEFWGSDNIKVNNRIWIKIK